MSAFLSNTWSWNESLRSLIDFIVRGGVTSRYRRRKRKLSLMLRILPASDLESLTSDKLRCLLRRPHGRGKVPVVQVLNTAQRELDQHAPIAVSTVDLIIGP